jgi:hypothetical protein
MHTRFEYRVTSYEIQLRDKSYEYELQIMNITFLDLLANNLYESSHHPYPLICDLPPPSPNLFSAWPAGGLVFYIKDGLTKNAVALSGVRYLCGMG